MSVDDYSYSFSFADNTRIQKIGDIFPSLVAHRQLLNGRVISHFFVQLFLKYPRFLFSIINSLVVLSEIVLVSRFLSEKTTGSRNLLLTIGVILVWIYTPSFGENYLWLDGAINYHWANALMLLFLLPYYNEFLNSPRKMPLLFVVIQIVISFLAGAYSENVSLIMIFLACSLILGLWIKKKKIPIKLLLYVIIAAFGYCFLMSAPATATRSASLNFSALANNLHKVLILSKNYLLAPYIIFVLLLTLCIYYQASKEKIILSLLLWFAGLLSLLTFVFAAYFVERHFSCTIFLTVFASILLLDELLLLEKDLICRLLLSFLVVLFLFQFPIGVLDIIVSHHKEIQREQLIETTLSAGEKTVVLPNYYPSTKYAIDFILDPRNSETWPNNVICSYYELQEVYGADPDN